MKNPWMSAWLSAANRAAGPARGQISAEMSRQQNDMFKLWSEQATQMWMQMWFPWMPKSGTSKKR